MAKFYAIVYGEDGTCGDSWFWVNAPYVLEYIPGETLEDLVPKLRASCSDPEEIEELDEAFSEIVGFWVVTEEELEQINFAAECLSALVYDEGSGGGDSSDYQRNAMMKKMAKVFDSRRNLG